MTVRTLSQKTAWSAGRTNLFTLSPWYFFLFDSIWQVVRIGICPWTLRMAPGCLWKLWKYGAFFCVTSPGFPSPLSAGARSDAELCGGAMPPAPYISNGPPGSVRKIWFQLFACSNVSSNTYLCSYALIILIFIQPLEGWYHSSSAWLYQAVIDVCTGTGTQLDRVTVPFPFPKTKSKGSPRAVSYLPSRLL